MLKLIITEDKHLKGWCWVSQKQKYWAWFKVGSYVNHSRKKKGDMNLEKIYVHVCACIWRIEINYLEKKT